MIKWKVELADNFTGSVFTTLWDIELIGDELRVKFADYLEDYRKKRDIVTGGREQVRSSAVLKNFMIEQRINLVADEVNGGLKSVFILKKGESKIIDDRAKQSLAKRFDSVVKVTGDVKSDVLGFMNFTQVEGPDQEEKKKDLVVDGKDVTYVKDEKDKKKKIICNVCGKEFKTEFGLNGHMKTHDKDKLKEAKPPKGSDRTADKKK